MQLCEEGTTSTRESKRHNEELNDLFLPLSLPVLCLLKITWYVARFLPLNQLMGSFPTSRTDGFPLFTSTSLVPGHLVQ